ncbi:MAG: hypothetical protein E6H00_09155 [Bacillati bacterium ANGP1]|uniref:Solute-binding protein family 5 domain-containing protein n=1 Tax=Candidatus Segetimicrobium genomatis TaxID=2569760 RepID=A0A537K1H5_9BACT|nr:MAG: hypothetical protein E6H00_09155 [Terrabacteria group bacterium ANGP1]
MRRSLRMVPGMAAGIALLLTVLVLPSISQTTTMAPVSGGKMVVAIAPGTHTMDASDTNNRYDLEATQYFYEQLFARGDTGRIVPWLAKSLDVSTDGLTLTLHLQPNVTFHDGTPFNAAAVKQNLERRTSGRLALSWMLAAITSIDAVDDLTVRINLSRPNPALPTELALGTFAMMSPTALDRYGRDYFKTHAEGTGPYILQEFRPDQFVKLRKNANYWRKGLPYLDEIELRVLPDISARALALQAGEVDLVVNLADPDLQRFKSNPNLGISVLSKDSADQWYGVINTQRPPLDDPRVRQAINYALDKTAMAKAVFGGTGATVAQAPIMGPMVNGFVRTGPYAYDPNKAAALLEDAGWALGPDGVRQKKGDKLFLNLWSQKGEIRGDFQIAELIQAQLRKVGIAANLTILDPGYWHDQVTVSPDKAKYDLLNLGWGTFTCDAEYDMNYLFKSDAFPPAKRNRPYYKNAEVDRLIELGNSQPTLAQRNQYYAQAISMIYKDAPIIQLFQLKEEIAFKSTLHGARIDPCQLTHPSQFAWKERR